MKGLIDRGGRGGYSDRLPTALVQEKIIKALESHQNCLSMSELTLQMREEGVESAMAIREAVLPLISVRRIELTPERKLRLAGPR